MATPDVPVPLYEETETMTQFFSNCFKEMLKGVHTMLPATIESFDKDTQRAKVAIAYTMRRVDGTNLKYPALLEVPVQFPRWGGMAITFPVKPGDECAVLFSERAMDRFKELGAGDQPPHEARFFDLADGFALMGLFSKPNKLDGVSEDSLEIRTEVGDKKITLAESGQITLEDGTTTLTLKADGKVSLNNGTGEAISLISDILNALTTDGVTITSGSSAGTWPLNNRATYIAIKALWDSFK